MIEYACRSAHQSGHMRRTLGEAMDATYRRLQEIHEQQRGGVECRSLADQLETEACGLHRQLRDLNDVSQIAATRGHV